MRRFASERVSNIMARLGLDEDTAIESRLVSRTIEGAQSRVEGYNFDMRKHVVEYDDVINRQRETIYRERDRILRHADLSETILGMVEDDLRQLIMEHTADEDAGEWNREALRTQLTGMMPTLEPRRLRELDELTDAGELEARLIDIASDHYDARRAELGENMAVLERVVMLRTIDSLWVEHLTAVDDMRRGIGLRAYGQRNPLQEFKIEAYRMFEELKSTIRHDVARTIFRVTVTREPPPQATPRNLRESRPDVTGGGLAAGALGGSPTAQDLRGSGAGGRGGRAGAGGNGAGSGNGARRAGGRKIGRNEPCFCGSGKKYKKCHGA